METSLRAIHVQLDELANAMDENAQAAHMEEHACVYYLDKETGHIQAVPVWALEEETSEELVAEIDEREWDKIRFTLDNPERCEYIPELDSHEVYRFMLDFTHRQTESALRQGLEDSLVGSGAFRRFKNILLQYPKQREEWFDYRQQRIKSLAEDWLETLGLKPYSDRSLP